MRGFIIFPSVLKKREKEKYNAYNIFKGDVSLKCDIELRKKKIFKPAIILEEDDRRLNNLVIGPVGSGIHFFHLRQIEQDIKHMKAYLAEGESKTNGFAVIDPQGTLNDHVKNILTKEEFPKDKIYEFNPTVKEGLKVNPMSLNYQLVIESFDKLFEEWFEIQEPFYAAYARRFLKTLLTIVKFGEETPNFETLVKAYSEPRYLYRLYWNMLGRLNEGILDEPYLEEVFQTCTDWIKQQVGITIIAGKVMYFNKIDISIIGFRNIFEDFLKDEFIQNIFIGDKTIDLPDVVNRGGVVLVTLEKGILRDTSRVLGRYFLSLIQEATFQRKYHLKENDTKLFHVLINHFTEFLYEDMISWLAQNRQLKVSITLSDQSLQRLEPKGSKKTHLNIFALTRNKYVFSGVSREDVALLSTSLDKSFRDKMGDSLLLNLDVGEYLASMVKQNRLMPAVKLKIVL